jgi:hypothetical protein
VKGNVFDGDFFWCQQRPSPPNPNADNQQNQIFSFSVGLRSRRCSIHSLWDPTPKYLRRARTEYFKRSSTSCEAWIVKRCRVGLFYLFLCMVLRVFRCHVLITYIFFLNMQELVVLSIEEWRYTTMTI